MDNFFNKQNHLTKEAMKAFYLNKLSELELLRFAEHISECQECSDNLGNVTCDEEIYLSHSFSEQLTENVEKKLQKNITYKKKTHFYSYCIKVTVAVCASLAILYSGLFDNRISINMKSVYLRPVKIDFIENVNLKINDLSKKIYNWRF